MRRADVVRHLPRSPRAAGLVLAAFVSVPRRGRARRRRRRRRPRRPRPRRTVRARRRPRPDARRGGRARARAQPRHRRRAPQPADLRPAARRRARAVSPMLSSHDRPEQRHAAADQSAGRHAGRPERSDDVQRRRLAAAAVGRRQLHGPLQQPAAGFDEQLQHLQPAVQLDVLGALRAAAAAQLQDRPTRTQLRVTAINRDISDLQLRADDHQHAGRRAQRLLGLRLRRRPAAGGTAVARARAQAARGQPHPRRGRHAGADRRRAGRGRGRHAAAGGGAGRRRRRGPPSSR